MQSNGSSQAARVTELEVLATDLGHALQAQTEATKRANASTETRERQLAGERSTRARALSRIKVGIERGNSNPPSETLGFPDDGATLVPLDDSDAPAVPLGRHTTIGRARESDLCKGPVRRSAGATPS